jgi:hypothetical protein
LIDGEIHDFKLINIGKIDPFPLIPGLELKCCFDKECDETRKLEGAEGYDHK